MRRLIPDNRPDIELQVYLCRASVLRRLAPGALFLVAALFTGATHAAERKVAPTFLHRNLDTVEDKKSDVSTSSCHYKPVFGEGDADASVPVGIARYGQITLDAKGACSPVRYAGEDQIYVVLAGAGSVAYNSDNVPMHKEDYLYLPAGVSHKLANTSDAPLKVIVMGFRTKGFKPAARPSRPLKANIQDVKLQTVGGHPSSTLYRLLLGDVESKRDKIAGGRVVTSLFVMEIAPGGTNFPHHHEREEEIYLVLDGKGDMVAGGGENGIEGRHPAKPGDAYYFRLNCTVGFYSDPSVKSLILAVRSWYPGLQKEGMEH